MYQKNVIASHATCLVTLSCVAVGLGPHEKRLETSVISRYIKYQYFNGSLSDSANDLTGSDDHLCSE